MSQAADLLKLLQDGRPHRSDDIVRTIYGEKGEICAHCGRGDLKTLAHLPARILDVRKKHPEVEIKGWWEKGKKLYWYQLIPKAKAPEPGFKVDIRVSMQPKRLEIQPLFPLPAPKPTSNAELWTH